MSNIKIAGIVSESIVDGEGIRYVIFTQGCPHNCEGCHNIHTHDCQKGKLKPIDEIINEVRHNPIIKGVTLSGGEPFMQAESLVKLARSVKADGKDVWVYSGFTYEKLLDGEIQGAQELLNECDVLVDGKFELEKRDLTLRFRGSSNQRVIDVKSSLQEGKPVIYLS